MIKNNNMVIKEMCAKYDNPFYILLFISYVLVKASMVYNKYLIPSTIFNKNFF